MRLKNEALRGKLETMCFTHAALGIIEVTPKSCKRQDLICIFKR